MSVAKTFQLPAVFEHGCVHGNSGEEFLEKLREASLEKSSGTIQVPVAEQQDGGHCKEALAELAMDNPVACVMESKQLVNHILLHLFKLPVEGFFGRHEGDSCRKTRFFRARGKGIAGHSLAFVGAVEDHQKGTLHYHIILFGSLPPSLLQRFAAIPKVCDCISKALDKFYCAKCSFEHHVAHTIHKVLKDANNLSLREDDLQPIAPPPLLQHNNPLEEVATSEQTASHQNVWDATNKQVDEVYDSASILKLDVLHCFEACFVLG